MRFNKDLISAMEDVLRELETLVNQGVSDVNEEDGIEIFLLSQRIESISYLLLPPRSSASNDSCPHCNKSISIKITK